MKGQRVRPPVACSTAWQQMAIQERGAPAAHTIAEGSDMTAGNEIVTSFQIIELAHRLRLPLTRWQEAVIIRDGQARDARAERQTR